MFDDDDEAYAAMLLTSTEVAIRHRKLREAIQDAGGAVPSAAELVALLARCGIQTDTRQVERDLSDIAFLHEWERG